MSITEEVPVDATECGQRFPQNGAQGAYEKVKEYISRLPPPFGKRLTAHAARASHEDVPYDAVTANGGMLFLRLVRLFLVPGFDLPCFSRCSVISSIPCTDPITTDPVPVMFGGLSKPYPVDCITTIPLLKPPVNFGTVEKRHIYRSGYPQVENFGYLKSLGLKTILFESPCLQPHIPTALRKAFGHS